MIQQEKKKCCSHPYWIDLDRMIVHDKGCDKLDECSNIKGCDILKKAVRKKAVPCSCCRKKYNITTRITNEELIKKQECANYIWSKGSEVFHRCDCKVPLAARDIKTFTHFKSCLKKGLRPAKCCNPTIYFELYRRPKKIKRKNSGNKLSSFTNDCYDMPERTLTNAEIVAVKRFVEAKEERKVIKARKNLSQQQKEDLVSLSRADCIFFAGKGYETFHIRSCRKLNGIVSIQGFAHYDDAIRSGFRPCRMCSPSKINELHYTIPIFSKGRPGESIGALKQVCEEQGIEAEYDEKRLVIKTKVGKWKIDNSSLPYRLKHINLVMSSNNAKDYHVQPRLFLSLSDILKYIKNHDKELEAKSHDKKITPVTWHA